MEAKLSGTICKCVVRFQRWICERKQNDKCVLGPGRVDVCEPNVIYRSGSFSLAACFHPTSVWGQRGVVFATVAIDPQTPKQNLKIASNQTAYTRPMVLVWSCDVMPVQRPSWHFLQQFLTFAAKRFFFPAVDMCTNAHVCVTAQSRLDICFCSLQISLCACRLYHTFGFYPRGRIHPLHLRDDNDIRDDNGSLNQIIWFISNYYLKEAFMLKWMKFHPL